MSWRTDGGIALSLALAATFVVCASLNDYGLTYDEGWYISGSVRAREWVGTLFTRPGAALSDEGLREHWAASREVAGGEVIHEQQPGAAKLVDGVLGWPLGVVAGSMAPERAGTALFLAACVAALYLFLAGVWGRTAGAFAAGALVLMPRVFAHAHLCALDVPVMSTSFICVALMFAATVRRSIGLALLSGLVWGIALSCKINAVFAAPILAAWLLLFHRAFAPRAGLCLAGGGIFGFLLSWPWLWRDTLTRLSDYFGFHLKHYHVAVSYFGHVSGDQPWHYPAVMTGITTPPLVLLLGLAGIAVAAACLRRREQGAVPRALDWRRSQAALILLGAALNIGFNSLPSAPKYNGVRLFLPFFPFLVALSAVALRAVALKVTQGMAVNAGSLLTPRRVRVALAVLVLVPSLRSTGLSHPYQLSYYNLLIGGTRGAVARGMDATYWGDTYLAAASFVASQRKPGETVWVDLPGCEWIIRQYLSAADPGVEVHSGGAPSAEASWAIVQNKESELRPESRALLAVATPRFATTLDGVPLSLVYDRIGIARARKLLGSTSGRGGMDKAAPTPEVRSGRLE